MTVTVKLVGELFDTVTPEGTLQAAPCGEPEQVSVNEPLKPSPGAACRLNCADWPAETVAEVLPPEAAALRAGAGSELPLRETAWGELGASSVTVQVAERMPEAKGEKVNETVQFAEALMVPAQVELLTAKSGVLIG